jgi:3-hydroxybutyryl-CoA dehydrogenase/5-formyl-3-hydroxy-2-methylpyridine 4-carboxylate dehydrogenase
MNGEDIRTVAVIGAGTMGPGMAAVFANHGFDVRLQDIKPEILDKAKGTLDVVHNTLIGGGFLAPDAAAAAKARIRFTLDLPDALRGADFVLEAIPERIEVKNAFFAEAEKHVAAGTIFASNTSGIPITEMQKALGKPERLVGMHWSNPPHIIPVIEVIRGAKTSDAVVDATYAVTKRIEMVPVLVRRDVPGFVENRILYAIMREALHLLQEGIASAEDIDTVTKWGIGYKLAVIGPLELLDVAGLDIYHSVGSYLNRDLSAAPDVPALVKEKVAKNELGIKTMKGLFDYTPEKVGELVKRRGRLLLATKKALTS